MQAGIRMGGERSDERFPATLGLMERIPKRVIVPLQKRAALESPFTINWLGIGQGVAFGSIYGQRLKFLRTTGVSEVGGLM